MDARSHSEATAELRETVARGAAVLREKPLAQAANATRGAMNFMVFNLGGEGRWLSRDGCALSLFRLTIDGIDRGQGACCVLNVVVPGALVIFSVWRARNAFVMLSIKS